MYTEDQIKTESEVDRPATFPELLETARSFFMYGNVDGSAEYPNLNDTSPFSIHKLNEGYEVFFRNAKGERELWLSLNNRKVLMRKFGIFPGEVQFAELDLANAEENNIDDASYVYNSLQYIAAAQERIEPFAHPDSFINLVRGLKGRVALPDIERLLEITDLAPTFEERKRIFLNLTKVYGNDNATVDTLDKIFAAVDGFNIFAHDFSRISRRRFLGDVAKGAGTAAVLATLAACGLEGPLLSAPPTESKEKFSIPAPEKVDYSIDGKTRINIYKAGFQTDTRPRNIIRETGETDESYNARCKVEAIRREEYRASLDKFSYVMVVEKLDDNGQWVPAMTANSIDGRGEESLGKDPFSGTLMYKMNTVLGNVGRVPLEDEGYKNQFEKLLSILSDNLTYQEKLNAILNDPELNLSGLPSASDKTMEGARWEVLQDLCQNFGSFFDGMRFETVVQLSLEKIYPQDSLDVDKAIVAKNLYHYFGLNFPILISKEALESGQYESLLKFEKAFEKVPPKPRIFWIKVGNQNYYVSRWYDSTTISPRFRNEVISLPEERIEGQIYPIAGEVWNEVINLENLFDIGMLRELLGMPEISLGDVVIKEVDPSEVRAMNVPQNNVGLEKTSILWCLPNNRSQVNKVLFVRTDGNFLQNTIWTETKRDSWCGSWLTDVTDLVEPMLDANGGMSYTLSKKGIYSKFGFLPPDMFLARLVAEGIGQKIGGMDDKVRLKNRAIFLPTDKRLKDAILEMYISDLPDRELPNEIAYVRAEFDTSGDVSSLESSVKVYRLTGMDKFVDPISTLIIKKKGPAQITQSTMGAYVNTIQAEECPDIKLYAGDGLPHCGEFVNDYQGNTYLVLGAKSKNIFGAQNLRERYAIKLEDVLKYLITFEENNVTWDYVKGSFEALAIITLLGIGIYNPIAFKNLGKLLLAKGGSIRNFLTNFFSRIIP